MSRYPNFEGSILRPLDLLAVARCLIDAESGSALEAHVRRAIGSAYYALFHAVAEAAADSVIGRREDVLSKAAWKQVYRALDHGALRSACLNSKINEVSTPTFRNIATVILRLQSKRHLADYDPDVQFSRADALEAIDDCEAAILAFAAAPEAERRAFVAFVLFKSR